MIRGLISANTTFLGIVLHFLIEKNTETVYHYFTGFRFLEKKSDPYQS
jgi:hypothetical protein